jgi:quercetin dioxygenase-like cupin family protein
MLIVVAIAITMSMACYQSGGDHAHADEAADPHAESGPDPIAVDTDHYKAEFENDLVRVLRIAYPAGEESVMHHHPASVAVFLTDHHVTFVMPDGSSSEVHFDAGLHEFAPAGQHLPKNIGDEALELVLVELKHGHAHGEGSSEPDPTVVDTDHYKTEFENEQVRVLRIAYAPGEESVMHHHPDSVAVFLTDQHVAFAKPDGTSEEVHVDAGQQLFLPAGQHLPKNIGDERFEVVLVELKS